VPELRPLKGLRVIADPDAIDRAVWRSTPYSVAPKFVLRIAPDEALGLGSIGVDVDDPHAIVESEHGYVGAWLAGPAPFAPHVEWTIPSERSLLHQGKIAGVPCKVLLADPLDLPDTWPRHLQLLLVTHAAYAHDLADRLGWLE
jgi:hypothetical protein